MIEPKKRGTERDMGKAKGSLPGEDLLAISALWVVVLVAIGIVIHDIDATVGSVIIAAIAGAAGIATLIKSRRRGSEAADNGDTEA
jgi:hypothetical protein